MRTGLMPNTVKLLWSGVFVYIALLVISIAFEYLLIVLSGDGQALETLLATLFFAVARAQKPRPVFAWLAGAGFWACLALHIFVTVGEFHWNKAPMFF